MPASGSSPLSPCPLRTPPPLTFMQHLGLIWHRHRLTKPSWILSFLPLPFDCNVDADRIQPARWGRVLTAAVQCSVSVSCIHLHHLHTGLQFPRVPCRKHPRPASNGTLGLSQAALRVDFALQRLRRLALKKKSLPGDWRRERSSETATCPSCSLSINSRKLCSSLSPAPILWSLCCANHSSFLLHASFGGRALQGSQNVKREIKGGWPNESAPPHWDGPPPPQEGPCASFPGLLGEGFPGAFPLDQMGFCIVRERRGARLPEQSHAITCSLVSSPPLTTPGNIGPILQLRERGGEMASSELPETRQMHVSI